MNDFEDKLRSRKFLPPPPSAREAVLACAMRPAAHAPKSWREWLWPSPLAWGAVTALLLAALVINSRLSDPRVPVPTNRSAQSEAARPAVYAFFQDRQNLDWLKGTR
jgi:hypothetical protein